MRNNINHNPNHIAIIMDGNGRWASSRGYKRSKGHEAGVKTVREITKYCTEIGIKHLTLFTFSEENWHRPKKEILALMKLLILSLDKEKDKLHKNNIKFNVIGNLDKINTYVKNKINSVKKLTKNNSGMNLNLAISYGSHQEIINAINRLIKDKKNNINESDFESYLYTSNIPNPDLLIRTGKENRISNFLLWQIAYTEIYFSNKYWPDFNNADLQVAIKDFIKRERRFGKIRE